MNPAVTRSAVTDHRLSELAALKNSLEARHLPGEAVTINHYLSRVILLFKTYGCPSTRVAVVACGSLNLGAWYFTWGVS